MKSELSIRDLGPHNSFTFQGFVLVSYLLTLSQYLALKDGQIQHQRNFVQRIILTNLQKRPSMKKINQSKRSPHALKTGYEGIGIIHVIPTALYLFKGFFPLLMVCCQSVVFYSTAIVGWQTFVFYQTREENSLDTFGFSLGITPHILSGRVPTGDRSYLGAICPWPMANG